MYLWFSLSRENRPTICSPQIALPFKETMARLSTSSMMPWGLCSTLCGEGLKVYLHLAKAKRESELFSLMFIAVQWEQ